MKRGMHHRRGGVHRQQSRRRARRPGCRGRRGRQLPHGTAGVRRRARSSTPNSRSSRATCSTPPCWSAPSRAATGCSTSRRTPTSDTGLSSPTVDLEQNTRGDLAGARGDAGRGHPPDPLLLDRFGLRRAGGVPDARGRPLPAADVALRRLASSPARGSIAAYATGFGFTGVICRFVSILGERYTHGHVFDFYRAAARPTRPGSSSSATGTRRSRTSTSGTASSAMLAVRPASRGRARDVYVYNLGTDETIVVDESVADHHAPPRADARGRPHRGRARAGSGTARSSGSTRPGSAALGWSPTLDDPRGDRAHARLVRRQRLRLAGERSVPQPQRNEGVATMSVIFSRAPLRISLGGGGTDLPSYYRRARRVPRRRGDRQVRLHARPRRLPEAATG